MESRGERKRKTSRTSSSVLNFPRRLRRPSNSSSNLRSPLHQASVTLCRLRQSITETQCLIRALLLRTHRSLLVMTSHTFLRKDISTCLRHRNRCCRILNTRCSRLTRLTSRRNVKYLSTTFPQGGIQRSQPSAHTSRRRSQMERQHSRKIAGCSRNTTKTFMRLSRRSQWTSTSSNFPMDR